MSKKSVLICCSLCIIIIAMIYFLFIVPSPPPALRFAIYTNSSFGSAYYFEICQNGTLTVTYGSRSGDFAVWRGRFIRSVYASYEISLNDNDLQSLMDTARKLETSGVARPRFSINRYTTLGGTSVAILYNGRRYESRFPPIAWDSPISSGYIDHSRYQALMDLSELIIELSPMSITLNP